MSHFYRATLELLLCAPSNECAEVEVQSDLIELILSQGSYVHAVDVSMHPVKVTTVDEDEYESGEYFDAHPVGDGMGLFKYEEKEKPRKAFTIFGYSDTKDGVLLEETDSQSEAETFVRGYTRGGWGGYTIIVIEDRDGNGIMRFGNTK